MRSHFVLISMIALSGAVAGCAAADKRQSFASRSLWKKPADVAKKDESKTADDKQVAKSENPFRKTADAAKSQDAEKATETTAATKEKVDASKPKAESVVATPKNKPAATPEPKKPTAEFDAETMKLIDEKLADASPEERAYWFEQLKRVDRAVIPQILQARQLTAEIVERKQSAATDSNRSDRDSDRPFADDGDIRQASARAFAKEKDKTSRLRSASDASSAKPDSDELAKPLTDPANSYSSARAATSPADKSQFPIQKVTSAESSRESSGSTASSLLPNFSSPRNALNRLLPNSRSQPAAEATANASAPVDLLRPVELEEPGAQGQQLEHHISYIESDVAQLKPGNTEESQTDYIKRHVHLRMLYLMAEHPERALAAIPGIDSADQEFWQQTLWAMTNYFDIEHLPSSKDRAGQAVAQLAAATQRLRERSNLEIHNLAFCSQIDHFGNFQRFPRDEFHPGERVLIYAEIENYKSELTVDGNFRTLIRSSMEILSPSGDVRWQEEFPAEEDLCTSYRRDYFHNYTLTIPDRLPLGPHTLKLTVFDELSGKMVSQSVNFVVR